MRHTIKSIIAANQRPDQPGDAECRIRTRKASEQAFAEAMERFGKITPENFREVTDWQEKRIQELSA